MRLTFLRQLRNIFTLARFLIFLQEKLTTNLLLHYEQSPKEREIEIQSSLVSFKQSCSENSTSANYKLHISSHIFRVSA